MPLSKFLALYLWKILISSKNLDFNCLRHDGPWVQEELIDVCVVRQLGVIVRVNDKVGRCTTLSCGSLVVTLLLLVLSSCL